MTTPRTRTVLVNGARTYSINIGGRIYTPPSPNTLKGLLAAPALEGWQINRAIEHARRTANLEHLGEMAFRRVVRSSVAADREAMEIGNRVHQIAEAALTGDPLPGHGEERWVLPVLMELAGCLDMEVATIEGDPAVELGVCHVRDGVPLYAGTLDAAVVVTIDGRRQTRVVDWKSGSSIYPDAVLTTSAYCAATHWIDEYGRLHELPFAVDGGLIAHLRPGEWKTHPIEPPDVCACFELLELLAGVWQYKTEREPAVRRPLRFT